MSLSANISSTPHIEPDALKKILLHTCCAPCAGYVISLLEEDYSVTAFFYNPNIHPIKEYTKRREELLRYSASKGFMVHEGDYDTRRWFDSVKEVRFLGERSERCRRCITLRLRKTFEKAKEESIETVSTTLTISPHKDAKMINEIGRTLSEEYGISFLEADFKKNDGFRKSLEISRAENFYRQRYCGCVYSASPLYRGHRKAP